MSATPSARILELPTRPTPRSCVEAYAAGVREGESNANHRYIILGVTVGLVFAALIVCGILAWRAGQ